MTDVLNIVFICFWIIIPKSIRSVIRSSLFRDIGQTLHIRPMSFPSIRPTVSDVEGGWGGGCYLATLPHIPMNAIIGELWTLTLNTSANASVERFELHCS